MAQPPQAATSQHGPSHSYVFIPQLTNLTFMMIDRVNPRVTREKDWVYSAFVNTNIIADIRKPDGHPISAFTHHTITYNNSNGAAVSACLGCTLSDLYEGKRIDAEKDLSPDPRTVPPRFALCAFPTRQRVIIDILDITLNRYGCKRCEALRNNNCRVLEACVRVNPTMPFVLLSPVIGQFTQSTNPNHWQFHFKRDIMYSRYWRSAPGTLWNSGRRWFDSSDFTFEQVMNGVSAIAIYQDSKRIRALTNTMLTAYSVRCVKGIRLGMSAERLDRFILNSDDWDTETAFVVQHVVRTWSFQQSSGTSAQEMVRQMTAYSALKLAALEDAEARTVKAVDDVLLLAAPPTVEGGSVADLQAFEGVVRSVCIKHYIPDMTSIYILSRKRWYKQSIFYVDIPQNRDAPKNSVLAIASAAGGDNGDGSGSGHGCDLDVGTGGRHRAGNGSIGADNCGDPLESASRTSEEVGVAGSCRNSVSDGEQAGAGGVLLGRGNDSEEPSEAAATGGEHPPLIGFNLQTRVRDAGEGYTRASYAAWEGGLRTIVKGALPLSTTSFRDFGLTGALHADPSCLFELKLPTQTPTFFVEDAQQQGVQTSIKTFVLKERGFSHVLRAPFTLDEREVFESRRDRNWWKMHPLTPYPFAAPALNATNGDGNWFGGIGYTAEGNAVGYIDMSPLISVPLQNYPLDLLSNRSQDSSRTGTLFVGFDFKDMPRQVPVLQQDELSMDLPPPTVYMETSGDMDTGGRFTVFLPSISSTVDIVDVVVAPFVQMHSLFELGKYVQRHNNGEFQWPLRQLAKAWQPQSTKNKYKALTQLMHNEMVDNIEWRGKSPLLAIAHFALDLWKTGKQDDDIDAIEIYFLTEFVPSLGILIQRDEDVRRENGAGADAGAGAGGAGADNDAMDVEDVGMTQYLRELIEFMKELVESAREINFMADNGEQLMTDDEFILKVASDNAFAFGLLPLDGDAPAGTEIEQIGLDLVREGSMPGKYIILNSGMMLSLGRHTQVVALVYKLSNLIDKYISTVLEWYIAQWILAHRVVLRLADHGGYQRYMITLKKAKRFDPAMGSNGVSEEQTRNPIRHAVYTAIPGLAAIAYGIVFSTNVFFGNRIDNSPRRGRPFQQHFAPYGLFKDLPA